MNKENTKIGNIKIKNINDIRKKKIIILSTFVILLAFLFTHFFTLAFYFVFSLFLFGRLIYNACEIDDNICILYFTSSSKLTDAKIDFDHAFNNIKIDLNMFNYIKQQCQQETVFEKNQEYKYKYKIEFFLPKDNEKYQESIKLLKEKYFILQ